MFSARNYTKVAGSYASKDEAYRALGVGIRCRSHAARMVKSCPGVWFLQCRLRGCTPACLWSAALVQLNAEGLVELRTQPCGSDHNNDSPSTGKRGLGSLAAQQHIRSLYTSMPDARPSAVMRDVHAKFPEVHVPLRAVQGRKLKYRSVISLGQLAQAVEAHVAVPPDDVVHQPFLHTRSCILYIYTQLIH